MQRAGPLHPSVSLRLEFQIRKFSVRGFTTTCSGFDFRKSIFDSGRAGALPSCANVCKRPKTDFLRGASGSTRNKKEIPQEFGLGS